MSRDFASKAKKRTNATRFNEDKKSPTGFITMAIGLVVGIVLSTAIFYSIQKTDEATKQPEPAKKTEQPSAKTRYQAVPAEAVEESDFSFHNELENKTIEVETPQVPIDKTRKNKTYVMQCGSFRQNDSAQNLKAAIAMNGFESNIKVTTSDTGKRWYRVVLGPYKSKRQAERERHQLERNNINNCRIW